MGTTAWMPVGVKECVVEEEEEVEEKERGERVWVGGCEDAELVIELKLLGELVGAVDVVLLRVLVDAGCPMVSTTNDGVRWTACLSSLTESLLRMPSSLLEQPHSGP